MLKQITTSPPARPQRAALDLATATVISFSLTFVGLSLALLLGLVPQRFADLLLPLDLGVVLLLVPLCALVFALVLEVLRAAIGGIPTRRNPRVQALAGTLRRKRFGKRGNAGEA